jgi:hypothetical protein
LNIQSAELQGLIENLTFSRPTHIVRNSSETAASTRARAGNCTVASLLSFDHGLVANRRDWGVHVRVRLLAGALAALLGLAACGDSTGTNGEPPTVLVTNTTCETGRCATLEVRAFVRAFHVPQTPDGLRILGEAPPGQTCLRFPPSWPLRIIGPDTTGKVDTTTVTWTPDNADGIYLIAVDSLVYHGGGSPGQVDSSNRAIPPFDGVDVASVGETPTFVPGEAEGWTVSFPSAPPFCASLAKQGACKL